LAITAYLYAACPYFASGASCKILQEKDILSRTQLFMYLLAIDEENS